MTYNFFLKNALIVCNLLIIWHLISIPKKKKKINSKNDKLTWKTDIINYHKNSFLHSLMALTPPGPTQETNNTKAKKAES